MIVEVSPAVPVCFNYHKEGVWDPRLHRPLKDRIWWHEDVLIHWLWRSRLLPWLWQARIGKIPRLPLLWLIAALLILLFLATHSSVSYTFFLSCSHIRVVSGNWQANGYRGYGWPHDLCHRCLSGYFLVSWNWISYWSYFPISFPLVWNYDVMLPLVFSTDDYFISVVLWYVILNCWNSRMCVV